ncbi:MAG: nitrous oxide reductase family maturation protein NosD, partial [Giesbergeria sp.]|nr:nitrous oxide reductase family maturation protein NosD [Giesbergeria sp.]
MTHGLVRASLVALLGLGAACVSWAATIQVQPGQDLAAAVQAAAAGDVVEVARGMYRVNLLIDKPITLRGIDRPTISGGNQGDTIR